MVDNLTFSREGIGVVAHVAEPTNFIQVGNDDSEGLRIYVRYNLYSDLNNFALENSSQERACLLLGSHSKDDAWIKVENFVKVKANIGSLGSESVWKEAMSEASSSFPGMSVVGWFHSHSGTDINITEQEKSVHSKFFSKKRQVLYITDMIVGDRRFYINKGGNIVSSGGFRIYDKQEKVASNTSAKQRDTRPEDYIQERYLGREIDRLRKLIEKPSVRPIDYVIIVLIAIDLLTSLLRPAPVAKIDQRDILANQNTVIQKVEGVEKQIRTLDRQLESMGLLDKELESASTESVHTSKNSDKSVEEKSNKNKVALSGSRIRIHTVKSGETISSIVDKYYGTSSESVCKALIKFNKLSENDYILPGDKLRIPSREKLGV